MRLRTFALPTALLPILALSSAPARGQLFSLYGNVGGVHAGGVQTGSAGQTAGGWSPSFGGGFTVNFLNLHVIKLGIDARGIAGTGTTKTSMAELSLRATFQPPIIRLKPFVQAGIGYAAPQVPISSGVSSGYTGKFLTVGGHAGLDRPLLYAVDWRVVDVGIAYGHDLGPGFASGTSNQGANFFTLATGLVLHF